MATLRATAQSMAGLQKPKDTHPWFALAVAVEKLIASGQYTNAVAFLETEFDKEVGND